MIPFIASDSIQSDLGRLLPPVDSSSRPDGRWKTRMARFASAWPNLCDDGQKGGVCLSYNSVFCLITSRTSAISFRMRLAIAMVVHRTKGPTDIFNSLA